MFLLKQFNCALRPRIVTIYADKDLIPLVWHQNILSINFVPHCKIDDFIHPGRIIPRIDCFTRSSLKYNSPKKQYNKCWGSSECRPTAFGFSKHHILRFVDFRCEVVAAPCIRMICDHNSPMCFPHLISWSSFPVEKFDRRWAQQWIVHLPSWI